MMQVRFLALTLGFLPFLALSSAQAAEQATGYYAEINTAASINSDSDLNAFKNGAGTEVSSTIDFDDSGSYQGAIGYDFGDFRVDGELDYQQSDIKSIHVNSADYEGHGTFSVATLLANGYYDFPTQTSFKPFIGGGAGFAHMMFDTPRASTGFQSDDGATVFAYHITGGAGYQINNQLGLQLSYRFFKTTEGTFDGSSAALGMSEHAKMAYEAQQIRFGVRLGF